MFQILCYLKLFGGLLILKLFGGLLFKTFGGSVNLGVCFFLHSDFGFGYAVSSYLSDIK